MFGYDKDKAMNEALAKAEAQIKRMGFCGKADIFESAKRYVPRPHGETAEADHIRVESHSSRFI